MAALIPSASATGSGTMTLAGPSTNSNQTITIPDATGTMMVSGNMPAFSAYRTTSAQTITTGTWTKVLFDVKDFDTATAYSTSTSRFTPQVSGYYQVSGCLNMSPAAAGTCLTAVYKNGSIWKLGISMPLNATIYICVNLTSLVYLNGSTDYIEIYVQQTSGSNLSLYDSQSNTYFQAAMVRGA